MIDFINFNLIELHKEDDFSNARAHKSAYKNRIVSKRQKKHFLGMVRFIVLQVIILTSSI